MMVNRVLIPVDGSKRSLDAINLVKSLFKDKELDIHLIHVSNMEYLIQDDLRNKMTEASGNILNKAETLLGDYKVTKVSLSGAPYKEIVEYAEREGLDLIVMTRSGLSGLQRYLVGSVTKKVISGTTVPVLIVPERD